VTATPFADPFSQPTAQTDPWAEPSSPPAGPSGADVPVVTNAPVMVEPAGKISLTMKQHGGFDAPWIVVYANTPREAKALLADLLKEELPNALSVTAQRFATTAPDGQAPAQSQSRPPQQQRPQQNQGTPPGEEVKYCDHGERIFRTGSGQYGPYKAWFCPLDRNDPNQCKAIFGK
jgi:hypothetical protein